jgi:hypothetical protein
MFRIGRVRMNKDAFPQSVNEAVILISEANVEGFPDYKKDAETILKFIQKAVPGRTINELKKLM